MRFATLLSLTTVLCLSSCKKDSTSFPNSIPTSSTDGKAATKPIDKALDNNAPNNVDSKSIYEYHVLSKIEGNNYDTLKSEYPEKIMDQSLIFTLESEVMNYAGGISDSEARITEAYWNVKRTRILWHDTRNGTYLIKADAISPKTNSAIPAIHEK